MSGHAPPVKPISLSGDLSRLWKDISNMELYSTADYQRFHIIVISFQREVSNLRRLRLSNQPVDHEILRREDSFSSFQFAVLAPVQRASGTSSGPIGNSSTDVVKTELLFVNGWTPVSMSHRSVSCPASRPAKTP
jgi:hypothetical protein